MVGGSDTTGNWSWTSNWGNFGTTEAVERQRRRQEQKEKLREKTWRAYLASWEALLDMIRFGLAHPPKPTRESVYLMKPNPRCRSPPVCQL